MMIWHSYVAAIFYLIYFSKMTSTDINDFVDDDLDLSILESPPSEDNSANLSQLLMNLVSTRRIARNLRRLTRKVFTEYDRIDDNTLYVYNKLRKLGIQTTLSNYSVLLSLADKNRPNTISKLDGSGQLIYRTDPYEDPLNAPPEKATQFKLNPGYVAYSPSTPEPIKGVPIYVNYGTFDDYDYLKTVGVDVKGHIVVARLGQSYRGNIVERAEKMGALAVILYDDPYDYTDGHPNNTYPSSVYLPESGVPRGTILPMMLGDPQTPHYPSIDSAHRLPINETVMPRIPVQPISYRDARYILHGLDGPPAPKGWVGGLNLQYNIGPGYLDRSFLTMEVNNYLKRAVAHNVISVIEGCVEPDRYVLIGNHRDAWSFGAIDPLSGTAVLLELAEVLTKVQKSRNWCPRRSIVLCSWDAEEHGLMGSTEWVQDNQKLLQTQAVAYLNIDSVVRGNFTLWTAACPLLYESLFSATKLVTNPNPIEVDEGLATVYDAYRAHRPSDKSGVDTPKMGFPGSGSDFAPFLQLIGIPVVDLMFDCDGTHVSFPVYHTMYETYELVSELVDRGFLYSKAMTQICLELLRSLSDTPLLPLFQSIGHYPRFIEKAVYDLKTSKYSQLLMDHKIEFDYLVKAVTEFKSEVNNFRQYVNRLDLNNELAIRRVNDVLMQIDRAFIDSEGLPSSREMKNVLMAPSTLDTYEGLVLSGAYDLLFHLNRESDPSAQKSFVSALRQYISVFIFQINSAKHLVRQSLI